MAIPATLAPARASKHFCIASRKTAPLRCAPAGPKKQLAGPEPEAGRGPRRETVLNNFESVQFSGLQLRDLHKNNGASERLLVPYIGPASEAVAKVFQGLGLSAESLPAPDAESLRLGRRHTSGKECLPMPLTLGSLLQRLARAKDGERFACLMPSTNGPCRFGVYNLLNNIVLERLGWRDRVRILSPKDSGYFDKLRGGIERA